ncbi:MAG: hypothetical protein WDN31_02355 [Hyphomicrobium sp.]
MRRLDALAARSVAAANTDGLDNEAGWFQDETAAGRYLAAATGAGEEPEAADRRFSELQARTANLGTLGQLPSLTIPDLENSEGAVNDEVSDDSGE